MKFRICIFDLVHDRFDISRVKYPLYQAIELCDRLNAREAQAGTATIFRMPMPEPIAEVYLHSLSYMDEVYILKDGES